MKQLLLALLLLLFVTGTAQAASVSLAWDASPSSGITGYKIYWGTVTGTYPNSVVAGTGLAYTVTGLNENTRYFFVATALRGSEESGYSNEVNTLTPYGPLLPPSLKQVVSAVAILNSVKMDLASVQKTVPMNKRQSSLIMLARLQIGYAITNLTRFLKVTASQGQGLRIVSSS